jgi:octaprenyl-diphosphate synthase
VVAFGRGGDEERRFWRRTLEDLEQRDGDLEHAIELLRTRGALAETLERARTYGAAARAALAPFRDCPEKRALDEVIDFCLERGF